MVREADEPTGDASDVTVPRESERVRVFLSEVQSRIASLERQLEATRSRLATSEQELATAQQALTERTSELARLREDYERELTQRGETTTAMAAQFLSEKFAVTLADMRAEVVAQYETRLTQHEASLAEKDASLERLHDAAEALRRELADARAGAALESEALRRQQAAERESLAQSFEERVRELGATVAEKEQLFARANELVASLQREVTRVQAAGAAEAAQLDSQVAALEDKLASASAQVKELERIVAHSEDLQLIKTLEREKTELANELGDRERRAQALAAALTVLREICAKSQAVRSIIAGARKDVDLAELFAVLDGER